jgi:hypothetical protein
MKLEYIRILLKERIETDHDKWLDYLKKLSGVALARVEFTKSFR